MDLVHQLARVFTQLISETSGLSLDDTLTLAEQQPLPDDVARCISEFHELLGRFRLNAQPIEPLFAAVTHHPPPPPLRRLPPPRRRAGARFSPPPGVESARRVLPRVPDPVS